jgi:hypothetical protein
VGPYGGAHGVRTFVRTEPLIFTLDGPQKREKSFYPSGQEKVYGRDDTGNPGDAERPTSLN